MFNFGDKATSDTDGTPRPEQRILGLDALSLDTSQEARPLPWLAGRRSLGLTWITSAINPSATPITRTVVVGKGETQEMTVAYLYEASMAGAICHGPVDVIHEIWCDDVRKWSGPIHRTALPYASITIPDYGTCRFYWGMDSQPSDGLLAPLGHPAYNGICYMVFDPLIFGRDRTSAPQIELVVERKTSLPGWSNPSHEGDVCPLHAAVELAAHPRYGAGVRLSDIDQASVEALSANLAAADLLCSPLINQIAPLHQQHADMLPYADAYWAQRDGIYQIGSLSVESDWDSAVVVELDDCATMPAPRPRAIDTAASETRLSYTDRDRRDKDSITIYHDGALQTMGSDRASDVQRLAITRQTVANAAVARLGRINALPQVTGNVSVLLPKAAQLLPGSPFRLRPYKGASYLLNCRVTEWEQRRAVDQEVAINYVVDYAAVGGGAIADTYTPPKAEVYGPQPMAHERLFALPATFPGVNDDTWLVYLPVRGHSLITGYALSRSTEFPGPYKAREQGYGFCAWGTLDNALLAGATSATLTAHPVDRLSYESQTEDDADLGDLLAFIDGEIISVEGYSPGSGQSLSLSSLRRGFFGSTAVAHKAGATVWIIELRSLVLLGPHAGGADRYWYAGTSSTLRANQDLATSRPLNIASPTILTEDNYYLLAEDGGLILLEG